MVKRSICVGIIVLTLLVSLSFNLAIRCKLAKQAHNCLMAEDSVRQFKSAFDKLAYLKKIEIRSGGRSLNPSMELQAAGGRKLSLSDIVNDKEILVLRLAEADCSACMKKNFWKLSEVIQEKKPKNMIVLSTFYTYQDAKRFCEQHKLNWPIYNYADDLELPIEQTGTPYFFRVDKYLVANDFQTADTEVLEIVGSYLDAIENN